MKRDFKNNIAINTLLEAQDLVHTDTLSEILDTVEMQGVLLAVAVGALTGVTVANYLTPILQESDTTAGDDFTDVATGNMIGAFTKIDAATEDSVVQQVGYKGGKRYVRVSLDYTGTGITAGIVGVFGLVGMGKEAPVIAPAAITAT